MTSFIKSLFVIIGFAFIINSCDKGPEPIEIKDLELKKDEVRKFEIKVPSNWHNVVNPAKRVISFSSKEAQSRFFKYDPTGFPGAKIDLQAFNLDSANTIETIFEKSKIFPAEYYSAPEKVTIDGVEGKKVTYTFDLEDGTFDGALYVAAKDSTAATIIIFETFAGSNEQYKAKFTEILNSVKLAVNPPKKLVDTITQVVEAEPASSTLKKFDGQGFKISIPDNFKAEITKASNTVYSRNFTGDRRADCNIRVDVREAKSTNLKKIAEENQATIAGASKVNSTKIGGKEAYFVNYNATKDVKGRIYYILNDNKLYQVSLTWFIGEEKDYLPVFEKSVNSMSF
ncbi:MAG: hypothetical protein ACOVNU_06240 [Candidatus Kapaibacteriota bacterium]|jgi:hypothetical protein